MPPKKKSSKKKGKGADPPPVRPPADEELEAIILFESVLCSVCACKARDIFRIYRINTRREAIEAAHDQRDEIALSLIPVRFYWLSSLPRG